MSKAGVSILLRAGNNKQAAQKFLQQLVKANSFRPIEVVLLFDEPEAKHLQLLKEFIGKVSLVTRPAKGRTFANIVSQLRYNTVLILTTPLNWQAGVLPKVVKQLCNSKATHLTLEAPKQALLVKREAMVSIAEHSLTATPNILQQALSGKVAPVSKPTAKGTSKPQTKPAAKPVLDNSQLDKQISELETELEQLDDSLTKQYQEIDELDKRYDTMEGKGGQSSQQAEQLKAQLKERVFKANDTLATLKSQHDELERLRIRRYSILA